MIVLRFHKWLISLALIVSAVSFSGFNYSSVVTKSNQTELLVVKKPVYKTVSFYFATIEQLESSFCFSFKTLLKAQNSTINLQFETLKDKELQYANFIQFKVLKHSINQDDYHKIFIG